jgi:hypothetical protein
MPQVFLIQAMPARKNSIIESVKGSPKNGCLLYKSKKVKK